jgi:hypothetical protein
VRLQLPKTRPLRAFQAAMVYRTHSLILYQASERVRRSGPVVVPPRTWIPPRSYYRRRSNVYWTTRSSCRIFLSMVRTPFERLDILY